MINKCQLNTKSFTYYEKKENRSVHCPLQEDLNFFVRTYCSRDFVDMLIRVKTDESEAVDCSLNSVINFQSHLLDDFLILICLSDNNF